jgi:DNA-binding SARP family transcriptional activator
MDGLALHLFGAPEVALPHGEPARGLASPKCVALLAYLALEPGPHRRDELATLLWGDFPDKAARASLRQVLKRIRDAIGQGLRVESGTVELAGPLSCDVMDFLDASRRDPAQAVRFDVVHFLGGLAPRRAVAFEEWAAARRQRLLRVYQQAAAEMARRAVAAARWPEAAMWADTWLECEPTSEDGARLAMEAWYLAGDRDAALARFASYRDRLAADLGALPSPALLQLRRRIEGDGATRFARTPRRTPEPAAPSFVSSLIGREQATRQLTRAWAEVATGRGGLVLIEGEAGIGKTRLAEEFLRYAAADGGTALCGRGYDASNGIPFGPVVEVLRDALQAPGVSATDAGWLSEVARLVPDVRRSFPAVPEPGPPARATERWRLFEGVAQVLLGVAEERPSVLFVDDLQWCDADTCALLHFLVRRLETSPALVVAALAVDELERDAPAARLCRALRARARATVVPLPALTAEQVWQMIREMGRLKSASGARRFAARVFDVTDGNPFHVVELLKTLFAQNLLAVDPVHGEWSAVHAEPYGMHEFPLPVTVQSAIAERVARLPYVLRDLLAVVAIAGTGSRIEILSPVLGISRLRAAALADELVERHLLVADGADYRCAHPMIAAVVRGELTASRTVELHRALALALRDAAEGANGRASAGEVARHADHGGEPAIAYRYALLAADGATARFAFEEALSWLDLAAGACRGAEQTREVNRRTADVLRLAGWSEPPRPVRRPGTPARGFTQSDLDLQAEDAPR